MTSTILFLNWFWCPLRDDLRYIRLFCSYFLADLNKHSPPLEFELITFVQTIPLICISYVVSGRIIHHDTIVEGVKLEEAILPALGFAPEVVSKKATVFEDWSSILARRNGGRGCWRHLTQIQM